MVLTRERRPTGALRAAAVLVCAAVFVAASQPGRAGSHEMTVGDARQNAAPQASEVVLRGKSDLASALVAALRAGPRGTDRVPDAVEIVVDVTPYVRAAEDALVLAILDAGKALPSVKTWRVARLGDRAGAAVGSPASAALAAAGTLRVEANSSNTLDALRTSIEGFTERGGRIVYLADWRFEDDDALEPLVTLLRSREQSLSVVGSEAAFSRAWNDGLDPASRVVAERGGDPAIGRSPFGRAARDAPWHGGDTAWPAHPGYWNGQPWRSDFMPRSIPLRPEDLRERLGGDLPPQDAPRPHPLPSAFGPWALQRACGVTGGRYVLWSWNPLGRSDVSYDFAKCDLFPPDLRPRAEIRADVPRRPLTRAIVAAWNAVAGARLHLAAVSPPLSASYDAREMSPLYGDVSTGLAWRDRTQFRAYLRAAPAALRAIDDAAEELTRAIDGLPGTPDDVDMRALAEAHLFRHVLLVQRFSLGEALEVAQAIPEDWFRADGSWVGLRPKVWIDEGADAVEPGETTAPARDAGRGQRVAEDRAAMLRRYRGTPFGETVARNRVYVWEAIVVHPGPADGKASRSPAQSGEPVPPTTPPTTPGGSSGGGAAPTGR